MLCYLPNIVVLTECVNVRTISKVVNELAFNGSAKEEGCGQQRPLTSTAPLLLLAPPSSAAGGEGERSNCVL